MTGKDTGLLDFVSSLSGGDGMRVEESLGRGFVRLRVSEAERRQAKHDIRRVEDAVIELLRNSRDAGASRIFVASSRVGDVRTLVVIDDGAGVPEAMHERVFDARVTSKLDSMSVDRWGVHGRGMALYSIKMNALSAEIVASEVGRGCAMRIAFDVSAIPERAEQSAWPEATLSNGQWVVRGPRNILRTCLEFALETGNSCKVYVGSPSEVVATMRGRCQASPLAASVQASGDDMPLVEMASLARDARELRACGSELGIEMSERTAHRIIKGEIGVLRHARAMVLGKREGSAAKTGAGTTSRRVRFSDEDKAELGRALRREFDAFAERYYLASADSPSIRVSDNKVVVSFELSDDQ